MKVTVYIPCYNAAEFIERCIAGILSQTHSADEVLLIDDGSRDDSLQVATRFPQVRVIRHERNRGLSAARNTAFHAARNEWVAALDSDCVAQPTWLATLSRVAQETGAAAIGGTLIETVLNSVADRWRAAHLSQHRGDRRWINEGPLFGNNLLLRRDVWQRAGGYDEQFRTNGEDVDLSRRIRALGFDLAYEPTAVVHHLRRDSVYSVQAMFWRYRENFDRPLHLRDLWRTWRYEHFGRARAACRSDLAARRFELLPLDILALAYPLWFDWKRYRASRAILANRDVARAQA